MLQTLNSKAKGNILHKICSTNWCYRSINFSYNFFASKPLQGLTWANDSLCCVPLITFPVLLSIRYWPLPSSAKMPLSLTSNWCQQLTVVSDWHVFPRSLASCLNQSFVQSGTWYLILNNGKKKHPASVAVTAMKMALKLFLHVCQLEQLLSGRNNFLFSRVSSLSA